MPKTALVLMTHVPQTRVHYVLCVARSIEYYDATTYTLTYVFV